MIHSPPPAAHPAHPRSQAAAARPSLWHKPATAWAMLCSLVIVAAAVLATGAPPAAQDDNTVREVVQSQLQALAAQDAHKAFDLADPVLRTRFASPDEFLSNVREQYPMMLAQPASVLFLKPHSDGSTAMQKVRVTDAEGSNWVVTYLLNRQQDNQWRIRGCLVEAGGTHVET
jgi:hypothetical protein